MRNRQDTTNWLFRRSGYLSLESGNSMPSISAVQNRRQVRIGQHQIYRYRNNKISTSKYRLWDFLPRFFLEQFRRYANAFFLIIALLQQIPDVSPTGRFTTALPLAIIISISAIKEIYEDIKRRAMDAKVNSYNVEVLVGSKLIVKMWKDVCVGEIVKIPRDQTFPADLVLISSSDETGTAYIETSLLDGETSLKIRQALSETAIYNSTDSLQRVLKGEIECELPNRSVNEFTGTFKNENNKMPLGISQFLLRGAKLKNTRWIFGVVVYTGHETRLLMNSTKAPLKNSNIDHLTNRRIVILFISLISLALLSSFGAEYYNWFIIPNAFYLGEEKPANFFWNFITFFILFNNLIPISLQVTLEIVRFYQAFFINEDLQMYDVENDVRANARTSNLNDELGQVKFIMSDKTGTLTKNVMKFKQCSVGRESYGSDNVDEFSDPNLISDMVGGRENSSLIRELLTMMSLCHTVVPEVQNGELLYQSTSPDEEALVRAACALGFVFRARRPDSITIETEIGHKVYKLLHLLEFSSDRKRMSIICHSPDSGQIVLYCKGADNVIFERASASHADNHEVCQQHIREYAIKGYRTLVFAKRIIPPEFYEEWSTKYKEASIAIEDRANKLADVAELIERELIIVAATAIEDKLQDEVRLTIESLLAAKIRIWMLTGDKRETAINIAQSSSLVKSTTKLIIIDGTSFQEVFAQLRDTKAQGENFRRRREEFALVISGLALNHAVVGACLSHFTELIMTCHSVVCCRMTPMQKAEIVNIVKKTTGSTILAIGDGANDVAMIQAASVGVGITGKEGLQAASASDYTIGQFRFLRQLLLVHGSWSMERNSKVILYCFYKNICLYLIEFWFAFYSAFSGQTIFERWTIALFNVLFTMGPPFAIGLFDRPVGVKIIHRFPFLYDTFQQMAFSHYRFTLWISSSVVHSIIIYFLTYGIYQYGSIWSSGRIGGWLMFGNAAYTFVIVTVSLKALMECDAWNFIIVATCSGSIILWFFTWFFYSLVWPLLPIGADMSGTFAIDVTSPVFWLSIPLVPSSALLLDFTIKALRTNLDPTPREKLQLNIRSVDQVSMVNGSGVNGSSQRILNGTRMDV